MMLIQSGSAARTRLEPIIEALQMVNWNQIKKELGFANLTFT